MPLKRKRPIKINGNKTARFNPSVRRLEALYTKPLPSARTGALYNAFSYPTKISPEAIAIFIATHTKPGDVVLDTFAGSGTTGLAALLCDKPTDDLKRMAAELGVEPKWGPRHAVLYELGVLGAFVSKTMCNPPSPSAFEAAAKKLINATEAAVGSIYQAKDPLGKMGQIRHAIWSDVLVCPRCKKESLFSDTAVKRKPLRFVGHFTCPHCKKKTSLDHIERTTEKVFDPLIRKTIIRKKRRPAIIYGQTNGKTWQRPANSSDKMLLKKIDRMPLPKCVPLVEVEWGDLRRNGYHRGVSHIHHFYTRRNLFVMAKIWESIDEFSADIQDALRLLVLSYNATHSTLMTRVVAKSNQKDFVLTGAQSGVLYISSLPVEKNIFAGLRRKIKVFREAFAAVQSSNSRVEVFNATSTKLRLADKSVDYVFTDPPFGDYIPYAELNQINEAWIGTTTHRVDEIIVSPSQGKDIDAYGALMRLVFSEIGRVLKNQGKATVVFHSAQAAVWRALAEAYVGSKFEVRASSVLDKLQASFKQVVSDVAVKGDPVLLLAKAYQRIPYRAPTDKSEQIIKEILARAAGQVKDSKERTAERLYSRYISRCLEMGLSVSINAASFYNRVRGLEGIQ